LASGSICKQLTSIHSSTPSLSIYSIMTHLIEILEFRLIYLYPALFIYSLALAIHIRNAIHSTLLLYGFYKKRSLVRYFYLLPEQACGLRNQLPLNAFPIVFSQDKQAGVLHDGQRPRINRHSQRKSVSASISRPFPYIFLIALI
jgi:hypothetical protein